MTEATGISFAGTTSHDRLRRRLRREYGPQRPGVGSVQGLRRFRPRWPLGIGQTVLVLAPCPRGDARGRAGRAGGRADAPSTANSHAGLHPGLLEEGLAGWRPATGTHRDRWALAALQSEPGRLPSPTGRALRRPMSGGCSRSLRQRQQTRASWGARCLAVQALLYALRLAAGRRRRLSR